MSDEIEIQSKGEGQSENNNDTVPERQRPELRLQNILAWIRTAKENLPAICCQSISTDRVVAISGLLDRLHGQAMLRAAERQALRIQNVSGHAPPVADDPGGQNGTAVPRAQRQKAA